MFKSKQEYNEKFNNRPNCSFFLCEFYENVTYKCESVETRNANCKYCANFISIMHAEIDSGRVKHLSIFKI